MHKEPQVQNNNWADAAPVVDSAGGFRYSCYCGKELKSRTSFARHIKGCDPYKVESVKCGYTVQCNICKEVYQDLISHLRTKHSLKPKEYDGELRSIAYNEEALEKIRQGRINDGIKTRAAKQKKLKEDPDYVSCKICNKHFKHLTNHLRNSHSLTSDEYLEMYPDSELASESFHEMAVERGKVNGDWINRAKESGEDLTEYYKRVSEGVSKAINSNPEELERRSNLMKSMWEDPEKAAIFRENQSKTAKITSARSDIQAQRAEALKNWRDNNPEDFYEKCTSKAFASAKRKTKPEKWFHKYSDSNLQRYNLKYSQSLYSEKLKTTSNRKQIDFMSKDKRVWIEIDGPLHFKVDYYQYTEIKRKDSIINNIAQDRGVILVRVSFDQWDQKTGEFNKSTLDKIQEILKNNKPGIYKIGEEYKRCI